ncbi:prepilin-type N-terminal cleavage/methylation domain-containing protein [Maridesulfovibrio sp.]|uniref:pilus assembly FimT family protein n=1 Tax=Maridesulfovibrio sp. TaxID=2795000 RepID=UPI002A18A06C|nr:prepilin-type N-terminal cleavage/methylation domain-containing protein [Maridesulfovibrio sp.]
MYDHKARSHGLTFIELLIVLLIVGMGWFTLMPNLDLAGGKKDDKVSLVNALIYEAKNKAVETDSRQIVHIDFESGEVRWNEETAELPDPVSSGHFNEDPVGGEGVDFTIYPAGFCDEVRLVLSNGLAIVLDPLSARFGEM